MELSFPFVLSKLAVPFSDEIGIHEAKKGRVDADQQYAWRLRGRRILSDAAEDVGPLYSPKHFNMRSD